MSGELNCLSAASRADDALLRRTAAARQAGDTSRRAWTPMGARTCRLVGWWLGCFLSGLWLQGETSVVAQGGDDAPVTRVSQTMQYPIDVAVDSRGVIYVADRNLPGIWQIRQGQAEVFFQADVKFRTPLNAIRCLGVDTEDRVLAGCSTTTEVYRFEQGQPLPLTGGQISVPMNLAVDANNRILVCDLKLRQVVRIEPEQQIKVLATIQAPKAVQPAGDRLWVLTGVERPLLKIAADGDLAQIPVAGEGVHVFGGDYSPAEVVVAGRPFDFPADLAALPNGDWVVSDSYGKCLWRIDAEGEVRRWVADPRFQHPVGIAAHGTQIFVADPRANAIFSVTEDGQVEVVYQASNGAENRP
jgi:hypothetical protein